MSALLIAGGLLADGTRRDILLRDGRIAALLAPGTPAGDVPRLDAADRLVLPGLVNAHTHGHANLMKGVADRWVLESSLTNGPWMGGQRDAAMIHLSTLLGAVEMLEAGCTACYDLFYEFPAPTAQGLLAAARAYAEAGMRAVIAPMVADRALFEVLPGLLDTLPDDLRAEAAAFRMPQGEATLAALREAFAVAPDLPPGITLALAPTIPHHCTDAFLLGCRALAEQHGLRLHMHIAESKLQALLARQLWGSGPVAHVARMGLLGPHFTAAHAIWLEEQELDLLARHGASVAHMPASNLRLGSGVAAVAAMRARGITLGLGTDGCNSADSLDMFEAMRLCAHVSRIRDVPREGWIGAAAALQMATEGSAAVLGLGAEAGCIAPGFAADLTLLDLGHRGFIPLHDAANQAVTCNVAGAVREVFVAGRQVVAEGRCLAPGAARLRAAAQATLTELAPRIAPARALAARLEPHVAAYAARESRAPLPCHSKIPVEPSQA
jgi:cytosine/adenosine deaminase-related metal-dependent hydrolase